MKKRQQRNILVINMVSVILIIGLFSIKVYENRIRQLLHWPEEITVLENQDSELLTLLMDRSFFSQDFSWDTIHISQENIVPLQEEHYLLEQAAILYGGVYRNIPTTVDHQINRYEEVPFWVDTKNLVMPYESSNFHSLDVNLVKIGEHSKYKCETYDFPLTYCRIEIRHSDMISTIVLRIEKMISTEEVEEIVNPVLEQLKIKLYQ